ncbi:MAG: oxygen-insensitive NAD(P)H nitroreductase [Gammaproteobacteria bacterium]|nr:oxygen-insensitive NAD(P)H nitroreductase [Gammaproteobacteria bacterium]
MNLSEIANFRYATKAFDPSKKVDTATFAQIEHMMRMSPSSINGQPWHFIIGSTDSGKARIAKGTVGPFEVNRAKVMDASHCVVFCAKTGFDADYVDQILDAESKDGRIPNDDMRAMRSKVMNMYADIHRNQLDDVQHWNEKQVYLNLGFTLLTAAALGVDSVPMEGVDVDALNAEFDLPAKGLTAVFAVSFGYRADNDANAAAPKSRLAADAVFTHLD